MRRQHLFIFVPFRRLLKAIFREPSKRPNCSRSWMKTDKC